jgi:glucose/arabinose dehydrogenase/PKD repeat protein
MRRTPAFGSPGSGSRSSSFFATGLALAEHGALGALGALLVVAAIAALASRASGQTSQHSLRFFGANVTDADRARIPIDDDVPGPDLSTPCDLGAGGFTVEIWLQGALAQNTAAPGATGVTEPAWKQANLLVDRDIGGSGREWGISIAGGRVLFGTGQGDGAVQDAADTLTGVGNVLDGSWHHVACVRDATLGRKSIYVDGILDAQGEVGVTKADLSYPDDGVGGQDGPWGPWIIVGAAKYPGNGHASFNGRVDELRLWRTARTQAEILDTFDRLVPPDAPGLVGNYRFEEGQGTLLVDDCVAPSPPGELVAGLPGNGEWDGSTLDPNDTAPLTSGILPIGFQKTLVASGFQLPTVLEFTPDGRLLVGQRDGTIWIVQNDTVLPTPLIQINAEAELGEHGLMGLCVDPNFAANGFFYVEYTTPEPRNRVSRFTAVGNTASLASELMLWQNTETAGLYHHGGGIVFGNDGNLLIATGDAFLGPNAQSLDNQHGKLLRVTPTGGIPPDNPFAGGTSVQKPIWATGLRNPFRISVDPLTGKPWIGDVGGNDGNSYEEVNLGGPGINYGWPNQEGPSCYVPDCSPYFFPAWSYSHSDPSYYVEFFQACVIAGPVYRKSVFPSSYQGNLFVGDYADRWIRRLVFDGAGNVVGDPVFLDQPDAGTIVDLDVGPDGALYFVNIGYGTSGEPDLAAVWRVSYTANSNSPPVVFASADPMAGPAPLTVQFDSTDSYDPDGGPAPFTYLWTFGDGGTSTAANPSHTYASPGTYSASVAISDGQDSTNSLPMTIAVGGKPNAVILQPAQGLPYVAGQTISFLGAAVDPDEGILPASDFTWQVVLVHGTHTHLFLGPISGITSGTFVVPVSGHPPKDSYFVVILTVTDSTGLTDTEVVTLSPTLTMLLLDSVPTGIPLFLDGDPVITPHLEPTLPNYQHEVSAQSSFPYAGGEWVWKGWTDGGPQTHTYVVPPTTATLLAVYGPPGSSGTFTSLGPGLGGNYGAPVLLGNGNLAQGNPDGFSLFALSTAPYVPAYIAFGLSSGAVPLKGGTLYVMPPFVLAYIGSTTLAGTTALAGKIPPGAPAGFTFFVQEWFQDQTGPLHLTASNGLQCQAP